MIKDQIIEQLNNFKYLGCNLSIFNLNEDLDNNVIKYNAINGCINRYLGNSMRKEVKLRLHNVSKPMLLYSSETWITQTKDTHPIPGQKLKFLTPPRESNPGRRFGRQGLYRPHHGQ